MVLWEITLGTAYFLGLKRTYKLALKIQRRLVSPKRPKIRQFFHRKTRSIFDVALRFHRKIQQRDIEVGRNLGNWILRWLDKMKPAAQIRVGKPNYNKNKTTTDPSCEKPPRSSGSSGMRSGEQASSRRYFTSSRKTWHAACPTIAMMTLPTKAIEINTQYKRFASGPSGFELESRRFGYDGVIRNDIMQWMMSRCDKTDGLDNGSKWATGQILRVGMSKCFQTSRNGRVVRATSWVRLDQCQVNIDTVWFPLYDMTPQILKGTSRFDTQVSDGR